ncbi:MAG: S49 family peptidase [Polyangiales bacterium]
MAASGGYYIASAADTIYARPTSLVGSIGVIGGKLDASSLADRIGVRSTLLQRGRNSGWQSALGGFKESERVAFQRLLDSTYERFIDRVSIGRKLDKDAVRAAAEGRVMLASLGKELKLVDSLGGLADAINDAASRAKLGPRPTLEVWPPERDIFEALSELVSRREVSETRIAAIESLRTQLQLLGFHAPHAPAFVRSLLNAQPALIPPYLVEIR